LEEDQTQLVRITKSFENLINQTEAIESEKGINTFGFGFPLLIRRDQSDNKLTVAPILIWSLRIKRTKEFNTWEINRNEDDPVYLNEVLINHIRSDSDIEIEQIPNEMLDDGLITKDELLEICVKLMEDITTSVQSDIRESLAQKLERVVSIGDKNHYEKLLSNSANAMIDFGGLFSIFEVQKQNIINDYDHLMQMEGLHIDLEDLENHTFQPISSVETDPSQQSILHALEAKRNILVQGPPGTGKSQTLFAVLLNALENQRKTIVVCEKITALKVLYDALIEKGLNYHCVLIRDIVTDRKSVVDSVRDRVDNSSYRSTQYRYSKEPLETLIEKAKTLIDSINGQHKKLDERLLGEKNWTDVVGNLLTELNGSDSNHVLSLDKSMFSFNSQELSDYLGIIDKAEKLLEEYEESIGLPFINPSKFQGDNSYQLERQINEDFQQYENEYKQIKKLLENRTWWQKIWHPRLNTDLNILKKKIVTNNWAAISFKSGKILESMNEIEKYIAASKIYLNEDDRFFSDFQWFQFYNSMSPDVQVVLNELKAKKDWKKAFLIHYLNSLLEKAANHDLPIHDRDHTTLFDVLSNLEQEQLKYIREFWFAKQIEITRTFEKRNTNLSVGNLYNKRSSKRFRRLSLRQIVQYDTDLFTTFFPIIFTSPDVASNLFKGKNGYFDIVMFDEASQLRLEDNLPAILKGRQVIIAGDEHQMPPSSYFSKVFDGTVEDEDDLDEEDEIIVDRENMLLSCESLLDFGSELNFEKRHLDFHYRSKHPYLIDFSNYAFYNQRLKPLPHTFDYTPIKYIQVDGTFSEHINDAEAEMALSIIEKNINRLPSGEYPTVGIATFNIAQRNHIKSKILERKKFSKFEKFNLKIQELEKKGMFVKNLENIQGDERDVIILSTTYGPGKDGKFAQRFGPINHSKGYKLLNVIITRAKYKVYVCSSVLETAFMNYRDLLLAEGANNKRAVFYAYLAYSKAVSEGNNESRIGILTALSENSTKSHSFSIGNLEGVDPPFEEEVYLRLANEVDESKLTPQMKVSEFRIDIVYDPKISGVPKIAIECDGAKYHSSREAYLHDKHRQKILESHGFIFHRIWSTKWWRNPQKETTRLIEFIRSVESRNDFNLIDDSKKSLAFTDNFKMVENYVVKATVVKSAEESLPVEINEKKSEKVAKKLNEEIGLGSRVVVKYLNTGKELKVQIVQATNNNEIADGVQKISFKSPLAFSITGHGVGDIVKVGNLDNFVQIIEVVN
jgi:very-short-patch-repair endonuclease